MKLTTYIKVKHFTIFGEFIYQKNKSPPCFLFFYHGIQKRIRETIATEIIKTIKMKNKKLQIAVLILSFGLTASLKSQIPTLHDPNNYFINSKVEENNPLGLLWWKCDSMNPYSLFTTHKSHTGLVSSDSMHIVREWKDPQICLHHVHYQHYSNGILVEGSEYREHYDSATNTVILSNGKYVEDLNLAHEPIVTVNAAFNMALSHVNAVKYAWQDDSMEHYLLLDSIPDVTTYLPTGELVYALVGDRSIAPASYKLAWKFRIFAIDPMSDQNIYVDALTGIVIKSTTNDCNGSIDHVLYGPKNIDTRYYGGWRNKHFLESNDNGRFFHAKDGNYFLGWALFNLPDDKDDQWGTSRWGATSCHHVIQEAWDMYKNTYGRNGVNNNGKEIRIHGNDPGATDNAFYVYGNKKYDRIKIGSTSQGTLIATYDIGGHEFTHGVDQHTAKLEYELESGALDESFADIFGLMTERYAKAGTFNWTIGEDANFTIRDMQNPASFGDPNWYLSHSNWINQVGCSPSSGNDYCGVHTNSGVQNRYFYLLSMGGTQLGKWVQGVGVDIAANVTYYSFTNLTGSNENYLLAREHAVAAARILYGKCSFVENQVCRAWSACNIGPYCEPCEIIGPCWTYGCGNSQSTYMQASEIAKNNNKVEIYPNPASTQVFFKFPEKFKSDLHSHLLSVSIMDITGRIHINTTLSLDELENGLVIESLTPGVYQLNLYSPEGIQQVQKIIKE